MTVLDLFCGAGGASSGIVAALEAAGLAAEVVGVDVRPQPRYLRSGAARFIQADALSVRRAFLRQAVLIWASPPCQSFCSYRRRPGHVRESPNLIGATREMLLAAGVPFVIENVTGAREHLRDPVMLCGSSFGLDVRRERLFEAHGFDIPPRACNHQAAYLTPRFPPPTGTKSPQGPRHTCEIGAWRIPLHVQQRAMGGTHPSPMGVADDGSGACRWMTRPELSQAIPPAFSAYIARAFLSSAV